MFINFFIKRVYLCKRLYVHKRSGYFCTFKTLYMLLASYIACSYIVTLLTGMGYSHSMTLLVDTIYKEAIHIVA